MAEVGPQRVGLLVIRAWREEEGPTGLRVRITHTADVTDDQDAVAVVSAPEDVYAIVRVWLEGFLGER